MIRIFVPHKMKSHVMFCKLILLQILTNCIIIMYSCVKSIYLCSEDSAEECIAQSLPIGAIQDNKQVIRTDVFFL